MGKVIINKQDATQTARRNGSSNNHLRGDYTKERAHVKISQSANVAKNAGVKMSTKEKSAAKPESNSAPNKAKTPNNNPMSKSVALVKVGASSKNNRPVRALSAGRPKAIAASSQAPNSIKSKSASKSEMGLIVCERTIDPEIALMANRAAAAEKSSADITRVGQKNGHKSMSGMLVEVSQPSYRTNRQNMHNANGLRTSASSSSQEQSEAAKKEAEAKFSKAKSVLIGVGVALVVAVIGFAAIAILGESEKSMCLVHFESNGGSEIDATEIVCGRTVERPEDPTKEGFSFEGWVLEGDPFDFNEGIYKNATLVAKWKANDDTKIVVVHFDTDGGSAMDDVELAQGSKLKRPTAPTKMGYVLTDWYLGDEVYDFDQPVNENITLKAHWERRESQGSDNNTAKPDNNKVTSLGVSTKNLTLIVGQTGQVTINVLPSSADYRLAATSYNEAVSCSVNKNTISCTANKSGVTTKVVVRDMNSGNTVEFTVTIPADDKPPVTDPDPDPVPTPDPDPGPDPTPDPDPGPDPTPDPGPDPTPDPDPGTDPDTDAGQTTDNNANNP